MNKINLKRIIKNLIIEATVKVEPTLVQMITTAFFNKAEIKPGIDEPKFVERLKLPLNNIFATVSNSKDYKIGLLAYDFLQNGNTELGYAPFEDKPIDNIVYKKLLDKLNTENFNSLINNLFFNLDLYEYFDPNDKKLGALRTYDNTRILHLISPSTIHKVTPKLIINFAKVMKKDGGINILNLKQTISHESVHYIQSILSGLISLGKNINENFKNQSENKTFDIIGFQFIKTGKVFGVGTKQSITGLDQNKAKDKLEQKRTGLSEDEIYYLDDSEYKTWLDDIINNIYNFILNFGRSLNLDKKYFNFYFPEQSIYQFLNLDNYFDAASNIIKTLYGPPGDRFVIIYDNKENYGDSAVDDILFLRTNLSHEKRKKTLINDLSVALQRKLKDTLNLQEPVKSNTSTALKQKLFSKFYDVFDSTGIPNDGVLIAYEYLYSTFGFSKIKKVIYDLINSKSKSDLLNFKSRLDNLNENILRNKIRNLIKEEIYKKIF